ncbi:hypothetical protein [Archangium violaceum]|uniref:hypothetical protein n=1 Tax=Archangium violaceum TaxID=83451 RepID=UPI0006981202|nr:hypothetical protein [Archangium violaceum]
MAGFLSSFVLTGLLAASPGGFSFDGPEVSARTTGNVGFFTQGTIPFTDLFERGTGWAELSVQDRIADYRATYGDAGSLVATFDIGGDSYRVELDQVGFPPAQALATKPGMGPLPGAPAQPIAGGVVFNQDMHGGAVLGFSNTSRVHAAAAVWGIGRVWRNGELLTDAALIHAAALDQGSHADDDTFRTLPVARPGDTELTVLAWNLPLQAEPRGFIQFDFDNVAITVNGRDVPAVAVVPTAGNLAGVAPPSSPVPGGTSLGAVTNSALSQQGVGGSGVAGTQPGAVDGLSDPARTQNLAPVADTTLPGPAAQQGVVLDPFLDAGRVSPATQDPTQPGVASPGFTTTPIVPDAFVTPELPGRVALNQNQPGAPGQLDAQFPGQRTPIVPESFQNNPARQSGDQQPQPTLNGFVPLTTATQQPSFLSTQGSFSVVPLVPGVAGPEFAFGGTRVSAGVIRTPSPAQVQTPAVPLVATPQPLNAQQPVPFVAGPQPLNAQPAVPLIAAPPPLNSQPISGTLPGATAPTTTQGAGSLPGLVPSNPNAGASPAATTPAVSSPGAAPSP